MKKFLTIMLSCLLAFAVGLHVSFASTLEKQKFEDVTKLTKTDVVKFEAATNLFEINEVLVRCVSNQSSDYTILKPITITTSKKIDTSPHLRGSIIIFSCNKKEINRPLYFDRNNIRWCRLN